MGTDRIEEAQGPCPCGRGEIIVYRCTRDHPFATGAHWWQSNITCATCKDKYALEDDDPGKRPALVLRADILARERKREAWYERRQALMAAPDVAALLQQFVHRLHAEPSTVAKYRLLRKHGLIRFVARYLHKGVRRFRNLCQQFIPVGPAEGDERARPRRLDHYQPYASS